MHASVHAVGSTESKGKEMAKRHLSFFYNFLSVLLLLYKQRQRELCRKGRTSDFVNHLFGVVLLGCFVSGDYCVALFSIMLFDPSMFNFLNWGSGYGRNFCYVYGFMVWLNLNRTFVSLPELCDKASCMVVCR